MKSTDFLDFEGPYSFDFAYKSAPENAGVYFLRLRMGRSFSRIKGETDIVYIGSSGNLKKRLRQYAHPGRSQWTNLKVNWFVKNYGHDSEFYWREYKNKDESETEEWKLLRNYEKDHHEKPPLNGADKRIFSENARGSWG
ncbi:MAG: GIY-YIG nuclease family protein [Thermoplasmatales archaeon]|nr:GIY-YIG nuclease family protein [Thermoplasmatales archaeon]